MVCVCVLVCLEECVFMHVYACVFVVCAREAIFSSPVYYSLAHPCLHTISHSRWLALLLEMKVHLYCSGYKIHSHTIAMNRFNHLL